MLLGEANLTLEHVLREWLDAPGTILLDEGQTLAENKVTEKISIINSDNQAVTIMIDLKTLEIELHHARHAGCNQPRGYS